MRLKKIIFVFFALAVLLIGACKKTNDADTTSSPVPNVTVNISININSSTYSALKNVGSAVYVSGGYRGIMLYSLNTTTIVAFDQTCTYDLPDAGGIVYAQNNGDAICVDCGSSYSLTNGNVISGPSTIGLKVYTVSYNTASGAVTVTN